MRNYGVENYVQTDEYKQKYIHTVMERYGVEHYSKTDEFKQKLYETVMKRYGGYPFLFNPNRSEGEIQLFDYIRTIVPSSIDMLANDRTQMTPNERNNWKANHELDIWIPQLKIAIEYQGIFWHDPLRFSEKAYNDKEKQIQCEEKGIILIQVNENDWINSEKLVKQRLRTIINEE